MKNIILYAGVLLFAVACNTKEKTETPTAVTDAGENPYTLEKPYKDWQAGDQKNAILVLKMLKAWETKNVAECATYFADTAELVLDAYMAKLPNDSIASFLNGSYTDYNDIVITMQDWESVISADKKDEWVTLWYKQKWTNAKGIADSMNMVNDAKIENGKIAIFDEYVQRFPAAKK